MTIIHDPEEFTALLSSTPKLMAIDYGSSKVGLALSASNNLPLPMGVRRLKSPESFIELIKEAIAEYKPEALVLGLPVNMDGTEGEACKNIRAIAEKLSENCGLPIFLQDERLTSRACDNLLKTTGLNRKKRSKFEDANAACLILESALKRMENC